MSDDETQAQGPRRGDRLRRWRARALGAEARYQLLARSRPVFGLPLTFLARYAARQGVLMASATAFRLFLWLMPLSLFLAGVAAGFATEDAGDVTSAAEAAGVTGAAKQEVVGALQDAHRSWWTATLIGGVLLLWTTRSLVRTLAVVHAHAWQAPAPKRGVKVELTTICVFVGVALSLVVAAAVVEPLTGFLGGRAVGVVVHGLVAGGGWLLISRRLPGRQQGWRDLLPGCVLFGAALAFLQVVSRVYVPDRIAGAAELYGSLGVAGVILTWLLVIGQVVVCSALVNSVWADHRAGAITGPDPVPIGVR